MHHFPQKQSKPMQLEAIYSNCDFCHQEDEKNVLYIPGDIWERWRTWTKVYPNKELLALFDVEEMRKGETSNVEGWHVTWVWLPKQRVTAVECEILESSGEAKGMIHSHHHMQAQMSGQDRKELMPAYEVSVVSNHDGDVQAYERVMLPCGGIGFRELEVLVDTVEDVDDEAKAEVDAVLEEPRQNVELVAANGVKRFEREFPTADRHTADDELDDEQWWMRQWPCT